MRHSLTRVLTLAALIPLAMSCAMNKAEKGAIIGAGAGGAAGAIIGHQMDKQAEELAYALPGAVVQRVGEGITVTFPEGLLFGFDSDQINATAQDNLRRFAASLQKYPNTRTLIVWHTDSQGSAGYNMDLSNRRALSAANFITGEGVDRARISTAGRGEGDSIATNTSDAGRQLNRRVEVAIYADAAARGGQ